MIDLLSWGLAGVGQVIKGWDVGVNGNITFKSILVCLIYYP